MNEKNIKIIDTDCRHMRVQVPTSVHVKELVRGLNFTPTRSENLKNKIYYFLSRIVSTNDNFKLNEKNDGYRKISSVIMRKVMGRKDYYLIIKLLTNPDDPIVETNKSYRNSKSCKGYRITQKYNTGKVEYKTIPKKSHERIIKHIPAVSEGELISDKYQFLLDQFQLNTISFDQRVFEYISTFGNNLLSRVEDNNEYQTKMVLNLIGRWLYSVEKIENNDLWYKVSPDNHRLNSSITNLKRTLRPFLLCNGKRLEMIDISSSQPYFLSSVMNIGFITGTGDGFNLKSIYPELFEELVSKGAINNINTTYTGNTFTNSSFNTSISSNSPIYNSTDTFSGRNIFNINYSSSSLAQSNSFLNSGSSCSSINSMFPSFMWGQFFDKSDIESIIRYQQSPFDEDFYKSLIQTYQTINGTVDDYYDEQREKLKDDMMLILFDDNWKHRNTIDNIKMFKQVFPGVDKWIETMHRLINKGRLSYLLQRTESHMVLNVVCREFHEIFPSQPIFTIHDAIYTYEEYLSDLTQLLLKRFYETTGVKVGVKTKIDKPNVEPKLEDIEEEWQKIIPIKTQKSFDKVHFKVFMSNIERGAEFLKTQRQNEKLPVT
jgi:hypothetical protein